MMQRDSYRTTVVGVFANRNDAERALDDLAVAGFNDEQVGILARSSTPTGNEVTRDATGSQAGEGAATGALVGGLVGAAASLLIPGVGPVIAGGILASVLGSAVVGAAAGGILGGLVGLGVPEEEARYYEGEFKAGRTLVTVKSDSRWEEARAILRRAGAYDVHDQQGPTGTSSPPSDSLNRNVNTGTPLMNEERTLRTNR
jgi:hypothetical protein